MQQIFGDRKQVTLPQVIVFTMLNLIGVQALCCLRAWPTMFPTGAFSRGFATSSRAT